jgi:enterochelin esterase-like enzyme
MRNILFRSAILPALVAGCGALLALLSAGPSPAAERAVKSPEITHTRKAPTGYTVTFRYANPAAKTVQIRGDWYFARPSELPQLAATPDHLIVQGQGILPSDWKPGDFPLPFPNGMGGGNPPFEMTRDRDGVWTYTTPLPSGVYSYAFLVDCTAAAPGQPPQGPCRPNADPNNQPWNVQGGKVVGTEVRGSQVYVPADREFNSIDYAWQLPAKLQGKLAHVTYAAPGHVTPQDVNYLVVYTPPNYDATRAKPYPTLYLSHGGGGNEMNWTTAGAAQHILDNLINSGAIQPIVVVMPNASGYNESAWFEAYDRDLIDHMIPYVEQNWHVSKAAMDRAFSGLSMGGMLTNTFMVKHPEVFQYYGMMSAGLPAEFDTLSPTHIAALKGKAIWIGGGWQDPIHAAGFKTEATSHVGPAREVSTFARAGIPATTFCVNGGHTWYVWRLLLRDFLTRTAFLPQPYAAW